MNPRVEAAFRLFGKMAEGVPGDADIRAYVAGGIAVAWWVEDARPTADIDAVFAGPCELLRPADDEDIRIDRCYNDTFSLVQEDYLERAAEVASFGGLHVHVVAPVDLVLMKASRLSPKDMEDIRLLIGAGLVDRRLFEELAEDALKIYIGNPGRVNSGLDWVRCLFRPSGKSPFHSGRPRPVS